MAIVCTDFAESHLSLSPTHTHNQLAQHPISLFRKEPTTVAAWPLVNTHTHTYTLWAESAKNKVKPI